MKPICTIITWALLGGVAAADPNVTNKDSDWYALELNCKHISAGQQCISLKDC